MNEQTSLMVIQIRNAHVHDLKHMDGDIPLNKIVGIAGGRANQPQAQDWFRQQTGRI